MVLSRMQFTLHVTPQTTDGASRLVHAMYSWLMKTRRAPSRHFVFVVVGCKGNNKANQKETYAHIVG